MAENFEGFIEAVQQALIENGDGQYDFLKSKPMHVEQDNSGQKWLFTDFDNRAVPIEGNSLAADLEEAAAQLLEGSCRAIHQSGVCAKRDFHADKNPAPDRMRDAPAQVPGRRA